MAPLRNQVDELSRSSNNIHTYVERMDNVLRERQRVNNGDNST